MKLGLYWSYPTRSLVRGGQRSLLAIFCVAVGVLAIVSLQLVGNMINGALTTNVQAGNGGDISVTSDIVPLTAQQITYFDQLKSQGLITNYTAVSRHGGQTPISSGTQQYNILAVNPNNFPIAGSPIFADPSNGSIPSILTGNTVIVTKDLATALNLKVGSSFKFSSDDGRSASGTVGGIIQNAGYFQSQYMLISLQSYSAIPSSAGLPVSYAVVYANVPGHTDANAAAVEKKINNELPLANVVTTKQALQSQQSQVQNIRYFLQIVGLLALLIGGVGIINTMQVLLRRRRTEIAMLKTAGYKEGSLYLLFGVEAALIGLIGGVIGAIAGIGASLLVKGTVENAFLISLPTIIDPVTVAAGVAIGFFTALIFGLMPIVQASRVRPIAVLRELPEGAGGESLALTVLLSVLLALLFFGLAYFILGNFIVSLGAVGGAGIFLALLSLFFTLVVFVISKLPVLERFSWWYLLIIAAGLLVSGAITYVTPGFGSLLIAISALGIVIVLLPRTWKSNVRMAVRNIGRQKARSVTTLVALFIGIFAIGLILVLGQNIKDQINSFLSTGQTYNSFVLAGSQDKAAVDQKLAHTSNIKKQTVNSAAQSIAPIAINGTPIGNILGGVAPGASSGTRIGRSEALAYLSSIQGYSLTGQNMPDVTIVKGSHDTAKGRNLGPGDVGTNNVLMPQRATLAPLNLKVGDQITLVSQAAKQPVTLTVVGFYSGTSISFGSIYSPDSTVNTLTGGHPFYIYSLALNPSTADQTLQTIQNAVPGVQTFSLADLSKIINNLLNNLIIMLEAIASLAMLAGIIIIANTVALAMLERRRELGILKAVGHTSRSVLGEVLLENAAIGFTGSLLAMALVTLATTLLGKVVFKTNLGVSAPIVLIIVLGTAVVCMIVAASVAWSATRVRPLEVLRYE